MVCAFVLAACGAGSGSDLRERHPEIGLRYLRAQDDVGFTKAAGPHVFEFPADHRGHPEYRTEWWYFTGNVQSGEGATFGFELTFFRVGLKAPDGGGERNSRWATDQVWMAHFALTDVANNRFLPSERMAREALGLSGASGDPVRVWVKDWSAERSESGPGERWQLVGRNGSTGVKLTLATAEAPVLNGDGGLDQKGSQPGNASYYYSLPRMSVSGTLTVEGVPISVTGAAWMDREWSTSALGENVAGWDWFGLRLSDGGSLMFYRLRRWDGTADGFSGGTLVTPERERRHLARNDVDLTPLQYWKSPVRGTTYPVAWRVRVPAAGLDFELRPYLQNQELDLSARYWEGAVRGTGTGAAGNRIAAEGYVELAGY
jgi:predicted secreted hydrolase